MGTLADFAKTTHTPGRRGFDRLVPPELHAEIIEAVTVHGLGGRTVNKWLATDHGITELSDAQVDYWISLNRPAPAPADDAGDS